MHSQTDEAARSKKRDFWLIILIIAALVIVEGTAVRLSRAMPILMMIIQGCLFLSIAVFLAVIYKKLLKSYRYTFIEEEMPPYPAGSLVIESCLGDSRTIVEEIFPGEFRALLQADEEYARQIRKSTVFSVKLRKNCQKLIYERDAKLLCARVNFNEQMQSCIRHVLSND